MDLIGLLVTLVVLCLIFGVIYWILTIIPLPAPFAQIAMVVLALIFLLILLNEVGVLGGHPLIYRRG